MTTKITWPSPTGVPAFRAFAHQEDDGSSTAMVSRRPYLYRVARGYRVAANQLAKDFDTGASPVDEIVYPFAFLWRQYLELELKALLPLAEAYFGAPNTTRRASHRIAEYWEQLKPFIVQFAEYEGKEESFSAVDRIILEWAAYDAESFTFRYPTTKAGSPTLEAVPREVSLRALHDEMEGVANHLESVHAQMWEVVQAREPAARPANWYDMIGPTRDVE